MVLLLIVALGSSDEAPAPRFSVPLSTHSKAVTVEQGGRTYFSGSLLRSISDCSIFGLLRKRLELEQDGWDLELKVGFKAQLCH